MNWSITDSEVTEGNPAITLELKDDSYSRSMWDFSFHALYKVNSGSVLCALMLSVHTFINLYILLTTEVVALCFAAYGFECIYLKIFAGFPALYKLVNNSRNNKYG